MTAIPTNEFATPDAGYTPAHQAGTKKDGIINAQRVLFGLLKLLEHGKIVPGQRLIEADLCARFDVGRNAVREALHRLEEVGVVELSRHRGATVIEHSIEDALQALELAPGEHAGASLYHLRRNVIARCADPTPASDRAGYQPAIVNARIFRG